MVKIEVKPEMCEEIKTKDHKHLLRVLMQGTVRDGSPTMNRLKYEAQIQILKVESLLVWFEQICHFIEHGMEKEAEAAALLYSQCVY
ncbi:BnaC06g06200D [Brassica napus]|uniref:BnaC06g06200D protein n=1 Tax=Brassica napus TaxID=3708 RepID=A0A078GL78_BRANA|nr:BnaC06g06200D [Brassica napus]